MAAPRGSPCGTQSTPSAGGLADSSLDGHLPMAQLEEGSYLCEIECTVTTGLEQIAKEEAERLAGSRVSAERGKIAIQLQNTNALKLLSLHSVDNLFVVVGRSSVALSGEKKSDLIQVTKSFLHADWKRAVDVWKCFQPSPVEHDLECRPMDSWTRSEMCSLMLNTSQHDAASDQPSHPLNFPSFRVSCHRVGANHSFSSVEAAGYLGAAVSSYLGWPVSLRQYDVEVNLNVDNCLVCITLTLTRASLYRRNIVHFGPTTLKATICYGLLRFAEIEDGEVVVDPMCGTSAIAVEGVICFPGCFFVTGENYPEAIDRSYQNMQPRGRPADVVRWDACHLPLRDQSVDAFVSDLPFGRRVGSRGDNRRLYPGVLREMARTAKCGTGRAVLLSQDTSAMSAALKVTTPFWKRTITHWINVGGLKAGAYLLKRTSEPFHL